MEIFTSNYYAGFGDKVTKRYYKKEDKIFCNTTIYGYWSSRDTVEEISIEEMEKILLAEITDCSKEIIKQSQKITEFEKIIKKLKNS